MKIQRVIALAATMMAATGRAQLALDHVAQANCAGCDSLYYSAPVGTGPDRVLVVSVVDICLGASGITDAVSSITFGGADLSFYARTVCGVGCTAGAGANADDVYIDHWYLVAPDSGTNLVVVTVPTTSCGINSHFLLSGAVSFTGANQAQPIASSAGATNQSAAGGGNLTTGVTVPSAPGDLVLDEVCNGTAIDSPLDGGGGLYLTNVTSGNACGNQAAGLWAGAAPAVTSGWTVAPDIWIEQAVVIVPSDAGASDGGTASDSGMDAGVDGGTADSRHEPPLTVACDCQSDGGAFGAGFCLLFGAWLGSRRPRAQPGP